MGQYLILSVFVFRSSYSKKLEIFFIGNHFDDKV